jgi:1,4-dihydroxy-2-naphthoate octaprenyltransferase
MRDRRAVKLKTWFYETRPQFLLLSPVLAFLGTSMALYEGFFNLGNALMASIGLVAAHTSVNTLNDYFDYRSGIDLEAESTPFSGGSGILPAGLLKPRQVLYFGLTCFFIALPIGIYFVVVRGLLLLPLIVVGAVCVLFYTPIITRIPWPEWAPGAGLGALPVLGFYYIQTGVYTLSAVLASIPSGILVHNLLLLNEFPDMEADRNAGRKTLPIILGERKASIVYSASTLVVYIWIICGVATGHIPTYCLISLLTLPFAEKAIKGTLKHRERSKLLPAMGSNVIVVLLTQLLMGIGYVLAVILQR